jgi:hypothetical protein
VPISVGDLVTYKDTEKDPPPVGRVVLRERDAMGERMWLVAWEQPDGREQRLKMPERSLRRLTGS